jgi:CubicO group peptidase (beta-lactamase class C family)
MARMRRILSSSQGFLLIITTLGLPVFSQALPSADPQDLGMSGDRLRRLDTAMKGFINEDRVADIVTMIVRNGSVAQLKSYGYLDREAKVPMPTDAIFRIASQSKAVTSGAAMILVEEGKLLLTDPVSRYIPEFQNTTVALPLPGGGIRVEPAKRPITILDLMTHTAGISYGWGPARAAYQWEGIQDWNFTAIDEPIGKVHSAGEAPITPSTGSIQPRTWWLS